MDELDEQPVVTYGPAARLLEQLRIDEEEEFRKHKPTWPYTMYLGVRFNDDTYGLVSPVDWDPSWTQQEELLIGLHAAVQWAARHRILRGTPDTLDEKQIDHLLASVQKNEDRGFPSLEQLVDDLGAE